MKRQQGVALVTALLVVALVTIIAAAMTGRLHLDLRRVENQHLLEQGFQYALGLEALAGLALTEDARRSPTNDHNNENWARPLPPLPVDGGLVTGQMRDLDGRFNLNNLLIDDTPQATQLAIFRRLLQVLELSPALADGVVDWLDSDSLPSPRGAEDNTYARADPPYRAANQAFYHPSELALVTGFDQRAMQRLRPHIAALPVTDRPTRINVNTASRAVLRALHPTITEQVADVLFQEGLAQWPSVANFREHPLLVGRVAGLSNAEISVDSQYFLVHSTVQLDQRLQHFYSVVEQQGAWRTTWRSRVAY